MVKNIRWNYPKYIYWKNLQGGNIMKNKKTNYCKDCTNKYYYFCGRNGFCFVKDFKGRENARKHNKNK